MSLARCPVALDLMDPQTCRLNAAFPLITHIHCHIGPPCPLMICFVWHSFISLSLSLSLSPSLHLLQSHLSIIFFSLSSVNFFSYSSPHRPLAMFIASLLLLCSIVPNSYLSNLLKNFTPSSMFHCYWIVLLTTYFIVDCCRRVHPHALPLPPFFST